METQRIQDYDCFDKIVDEVSKAPQSKFSQ